jgi:homoserine acetyltransferase
MRGSSHDRTDILGHVGPGAAFDPERFCIVTTDALGLGLSVKPTGGLQGGCARYTVRDLVRLQRQA